MKRITVVLPSTLTVPAVKGGAVEQLLDDIVKKNEKRKRLYLDIVAHWDKDLPANMMSYNCCSFHYIKFPTLLIRINSVLNSKKIMNENIYFNILADKITGLGNRTVVFEGGQEFAMRFKQRFDDFDVIFHTHGDHNYFSAEQVVIFNSFTCIISVSNLIRKKLIDLGINAEKIKVLHNGINTSMFFNNDNDLKSYASSKFPKLSNKKFIFFYGRIIKEKGLLELIEAFKYLKRDDVNLVVAGSKTFGEKRFIKDSYEKKVYAASQGVPHIMFLGYVNHNDIPWLLNSAYMCVLPSIWDEPFSLAVIETMLSGCPLITTNKGGNPEITEGTSIKLIEYDENFIENLSRAIKIYLDDTDIRKKSQMTQVKRISYFDTERYYQEYCDIIESFL